MAFKVFMLLKPHLTSFANSLINLLYLARSLGFGGFGHGKGHGWFITFIVLLIQFVAKIPTQILFAYINIYLYIYIHICIYLYFE